MFGKNPIRPPVAGDGNQLDVVAIFSTLQGEGPHAGVPSVFLRLGGCNLACSFCDTEFEQFSSQSLDEVLKDIEVQAKENGKRVRNLVVITGGEPLRQPIETLCVRLIDAGFMVQIETNGTLWRNLPEAVEIVCSPKATQGRYFPVRDDVLTRTNALKFLIDAEDIAYNHVPEIGQNAYNIPVFVQPMDVADPIRNAANRARAVALASQYGYRLSLQMHKWLNIP